MGSSGWETFSWYFFRISGVGLIFLALIHVFLMHVANDVSATNYDYIAERYANPFWRVYDLLLLTLAPLARAERAAHRLRRLHQRAG